MEPRIAWLLASVVVIGCGCERTVSPYADSAGEGGGTWLVTGFCATDGIAANENDLFVISCGEVLHASPHPKSTSDYQIVDSTGYVAAIAVDADHLFVASGKAPIDGAPNSGQSVIYERSISDGSIVTLATPDNPIALAIDGEDVFWIDAPEETKTPTISLAKAPKGGGATATLATSLPYVNAIAAGVDDIYLATADSILAVPKDGSSPPVTIATGQANPTALAADANAIYWTTQGEHVGGPGALFAASISDGSIQTLATGLAGATSVAIDATRVYFTGIASQVPGDTVGSMLRDGGDTKTIGWGQGGPIYLAATSSALYWTDTEGDSLTSGAIKVAESE